MCSPTKDNQGDGVDSSLSRNGTIFYHRWQQRLEKNTAAGFERLGYAVATHRRLTILLGFVFIAICGVGFLNFELLSDGDKLWAPTGSASTAHQDTVEYFFGTGDSYAQLLFRSTDGSSLLTVAAFEQIWDVNDAAVAATTANGNDYSTLCSRDARGYCQTKGVLAFWDGDRTRYDAAVSTDAELLAAVSNATYPDGSDVGRDTVFGLYTIAADGSVATAQALMVSYSLDGAASSQSMQESWQKDFLDVAEATMVTELTAPVEGFYIADRSFDDELSRSVGSETFLFVISFILMIAFVQLQLGKFDRVRGRKGLALAGVVTVVLAGFAAYGVCSGFGVPFTSLVQIFPFILLGVGVDDMLIITAHFDEEDPALPTNERVSKALGKCGLSITYTSISSWLAFSLGAIPALTSLPAVRYFCWYASTSFLFDFFLQVTVFVALLCWDADRMKSNRLDLLCCVHYRRPVPGSATAAAAADAAAAAADSPDAATPPGFFSRLTLPCGISKRSAEKNTTAAAGTATLAAGAAVGNRLDDSNPMREPLSRWFYSKYAPLLLRGPVQAFVAVAVLTLVSASIWGVTQVEMGFQILDLVPDDSYARAFTENAREVELSIGMDTYVPVGLYTLAMDYTDADVQAAIFALEESVLALTHVDGPLDSWLGSFVAWAAADAEYASAVTTVTNSNGMKVQVFGNADGFYGALDAYLATADGTRFTDDIIFASVSAAAVDGGVTTGEIAIARSNMFYVDVPKTSQQTGVLEDIRVVCDNADAVLEPRPFSYSPMDIFTEQYLVMWNNVLNDFGVAIAAVGALSFLILGRIRYTVMVSILVGIADMLLLGALYFWSLQINAITGIQLVMAAGLIIDYVAHPVGHITRTPERLPVLHRVQLGLGEIGPSVLLGGATTLLGVIPMGFAGNEIFRSFFRVFLCIVLYGLFFGLVVAPILITWIPFPGQGLKCCMRTQKGGPMAAAVAGGKLTDVEAAAVVAAGGGGGGGDGKGFFKGQSQLSSATVIGSMADDDENDRRPVPA